MSAGSNFYLYFLSPIHSKIIDFLRKDDKIKVQGVRYVAHTMHKKFVIVIDMQEISRNGKHAVVICASIWCTNKGKIFFSVLSSRAEGP